jgi:hypothetical protein
VYFFIADLTKSIDRQIFPHIFFDLMIIPTSKTSNKQGSMKKGRSNFILSRVMAAVSASSNNRVKRDEGQQNVFHPFTIKVGRRESVCTYRSIDGDTCHTADTSSSFDDTLGLDFDNTSDVGSSSPPPPALMRKLRSSKRSVHFAPQTSVRYTISRGSYTQEEQRNCWYQSEDYERIHSSCRRLLLKHEQCIAENRVMNYCMRGLENQSALAFEWRARTRKGAMMDVLGAQAKYPGDAEVIASRYESVSSSSRIWAHCVGLRDQKAAERYYDV